MTASTRQLPHEILGVLGKEEDEYRLLAAFRRA